MSLPERIEQAVRSVIDPMEEIPSLSECPMEEVNLLIDEYLAAIQVQLLEVISANGDIFLQAGDSAGLCAVCIAGGVDLPPDTLLRTCQAIVESSLQRNEYLGDTPMGEPIYMVALEL